MWLVNNLMPKYLGDVSEVCKGWPGRLFAQPTHLMCMHRLHKVWNSLDTQLDSHCMMLQALKQKLEGSLTALFGQADNSCSMSHRQLEASDLDILQYLW